MPTPLPPTTRLVRSADAVWREVEGRSVVISLESGRVRTLNATASHLWSVLDGKTVGELHAILRDEYPDETPEKVRDDVDAFLDELVARGLARAVPA